MTVPHPLQQLGLFAAQYYQPVDTSSQVSRLPGTAVAPCLCHDPFFSGDCRWPYCGWKSPAVSSHESEETP